MLIIMKTIEQLAGLLPTTYNTDDIIKIINADMPSDEEDVTPYLTKWTVAIAYRNVCDNTGGPFGALLLKGREVVAVGANHVVPEKNPGRHAEMVCYDDYLKRHGDVDLTGLKLVTSCECCPQCYATAISCGLTDIHYAATAQRAGESGFSDAEMWRFMQMGYDHNAFRDASQKTNRVITPQGDIITPQTRPGLGYAALPSVQMITQAIHQTGNIFDLPEGSIVATTDKIHPTALCLSHWANVGFSPERDKQTSRTKQPHVVYGGQNEELLYYSRDPDKKPFTHGEIMTAMQPENKVRIMKKVHIQPQICNKPFVKFDELVNQHPERMY